MPGYRAARANNPPAVRRSNTSLASRQRSSCSVSALIWQPFVRSSARGWGPTALLLLLSPRALEEAEFLRTVADQQVLGLLVVVEHHLVRFASDARLFVAAKRCMRGVGVVAVGPDPARLDRPAEAVATIGVAAPDPGAEAIQRIIGNRQGFFVGLECRDRDDRAEDLLLENAHFVVALKHCGPHVEAAREVPAQARALATSK